MSAPVIMHVDMDAFYASVELRRRPDLRDAPVLVGGQGRGVVLSATYPARRFGVTSGMPMARAMRLVPNAVVLHPDFDAYTTVSKAIAAIFETLTETVEVASIDEAYLDLTGAIRRLGPPAQIGEWLRATVADEQQITCSVGIGPTKFVAKVASRAAKPDGLVEVPPDQVTAFLHPRPVEDMWGVGEPTAEKLHRLGLFTVGDLAHAPRDALRNTFGPHQGIYLQHLAWGRDGRRVVTGPRERSVGSQETLGADTDDPAVVERELLRMAARTARRLRKAGLLGRTVTLGIRFADFRAITRSATLTTPTDVTTEIHAEAVRLYRALQVPKARIRRVGVRVENVVEADRTSRQPFLTDPEHGWREAEQAVDAAVARFGPGAVQRAALAGTGRRLSPFAAPE
ncbi:DNA polymerase-4 [Friedmanniella endophytica]|uniref:DNA polymerase IV n=1 Tax=Microlunatus kandeliicorticis TaxID=1759536 RepID=A0A7W3P5U9_9ACTN|nr:DNA polymerase IV [Microlunatus kandeliicorticis]MBA8794324.1 DNA polymerase-4 [Microlunatus kandeliicorticis]